MALGVLLLSAVAAWACDTPVYRYAMYRWEPAAYEIYVFHNGEHDKQLEALNKELAHFTDGARKRANVALLPVDLSKDPNLEAVRPKVREFWASQSAVELPAMLVVNPQGAPVYAGPLDVEQIAPLADSPVRKKIAAELEAGKSGVLLFVEGKKEAENKRAMAEVEKLVASISAGKLELYDGPEDVNGNPTTDADPVEHEISLLILSPDDPAEKWLVHSLLAIEDDLAQLADQPMVFFVYGRARALPPYIGPGITFDNLAKEVEFITGACSCTVKDQNPGTDLVSFHDWETASELIAEKFGSEEGNEGRLGDLFPQIITTSAAVDTGETDPDGAPVTEVAVADMSVDTENASDSSDVEQLATADSNTEFAAASGSAGHAVAVTRTLVAPRMSWLFLAIGGGLAVVFLLLVVVTFVMLKPRESR